MNSLMMFNVYNPNEFLELSGMAQNGEVQEAVKKAWPRNMTPDDFFK